MEIALLLTLEISLCSIHMKIKNGLEGMLNNRISLLYTYIANIFCPVQFLCYPPVDNSFLIMYSLRENLANGIMLT